MESNIRFPSGNLVRSRSNSRYVLVHDCPEGAAVIQRSGDTLRLRKAAARFSLREGATLVIVDTFRETGEHGLIIYGRHCGRIPGLDPEYAAAMSVTRPKVGART